MKEYNFFAYGSIEAYNEAFDNFNTYILNGKSAVLWANFSLICDILDDINKKAMVDHKYSVEVYRYLTLCEKNSTIKLRDLAKRMGYDYWLDLETKNAINAIDTMCYYYKLGI